MITRRAAVTGGLAAAVTATAAGSAHAETLVGVTATEIKIGNTDAYSGPASAYASFAKADAAFFKMVNDKGGVAGRKINFISLDDGYSPPKTVELVRRLVERDKVAFLFNNLGTPTNSAIQRYCNQHKVPQLFVATGAAKWNDPKRFPWTIGFQPSYRTEAQIYTKHMLQEKPDAKLGILYQNDDFGKDYVAGVRDVLGKNWGKTVVKANTYEVTDPTANSQIIGIKAAGADALLVAATPKFAAQAIREVHNLNWKPMFFMTNVSISVGTVMQPAGPENAIGLLSTEYLKDPTDPTWQNDAGMKDYLAFMAKYMPGADVKDTGYLNGFSASYCMTHVLESCNGDFSRENVLKQATSIQDLTIPTLLPGLKVSTSQTDYRPIKAMQLARWDGKSWVLFGEVIEGVAT
jgi:branched-chain amino acid transport system substrate-binding protein